MQKILIAVVILLGVAFVYMMIDAQDKTSRTIESQVPDQMVYPKVDLDGEDSDDEDDEEDEDDEAEADDESEEEEEMEDKEEMNEESEGEMMDKEEMADETASAGSYAPYTEGAVAAASGKVVLFFNASWCPSCIAADEDLTANSADIPADVTILNVDYDDAEDMKEKYGVTSQHTFVQVDSAGELLKKWRGGERVSEIVAQVQ